jgi:hypothetical protein
MSLTKLLVAAAVAVAALPSASSPAGASPQPPTLAPLQRCYANYGNLGCTGAPGIYGANSVTADRSGQWLFTTGSQPLYDPTDGAVAVFTRDPATGVVRPAGCVSDDGSGDGCVDGNALVGAREVALSGDGHSAYIAGTERLASFAREGDGGTLRQVGCMKSAPPLGVCVREPLLPAEPAWIGASPDGAQVYEVSAGQVLVFARDASSGLLTRSSCLRADGRYGCEPVTRLIGATAATFAPGGEQLYVDAGALVLTFSRAPASGALNLAGCATASPFVRNSCSAGQAFSFPAIAATPDSTTVWALSDAGGGAVVSFARDPSTGALRKRTCASARERSPCMHVRQLDGLRDFVLRPDGRRLVAVAGYEEAPDLLTFDLSDEGKLTLAACVGGAPRLRCGQAEPLEDTGYVPLAYSSDGRDLYGAIADWHGTGALFGFTSATGIATRSLAAHGARVSVRLTCPDELVRTACAGRVSVHKLEFESPTGELGHAPYSVPAGAARTVRIRLSRAGVRRLLARRATRRVEVVATDASGTTAPSRQPVTLRRAR